MYISAYTHAVTSGFHGTAYAKSEITTNIDNYISIGDAHVSSYDNMRIIASADPTSSGDNIRAYAGTQITAFIGSITSIARAKGSIDSSVTLGSSTDITGANVKIYANKFGGNVNLTAYGKRRALATKDTTEEDDITRTQTVGYQLRHDLPHRRCGGGHSDIYCAGRQRACSRHKERRNYLDGVRRQRYVLQDDI